MTGPARDADDAPQASAPGSAGRVLIRSEEQLAVSTVRVPARRVRLEKFVVTETRTITVQVSHEQVRLVDVNLEADHDDNLVGDGAHATVDTAVTTDPNNSDVDRWLTLSEERVVVTIEVVPIERVRLQVTSALEQREVTDTVRREQVTYGPPETSEPDPDLPATNPRHLRTKDTT